MKPTQQQRLRGERYRRGCRKSQLFIYFTHDPQPRRRECRVLLVESFAVASSPLRGTSDLLLSTFRGSEVAATSEPLLTRGSRYIKLGYRGDAISSGSEVYGRRKSGVDRRRLIVPGQSAPDPEFLGFGIGWHGMGWLVATLGTREPWSIREEQGSSFSSMEKVTD